MKFIFSNRRMDPSLSSDFTGFKWSEIHESFFLGTNDQATCLETNLHFSITDGYLRDFSKNEIQDQRKFAIEHLCNNWPVQDFITGTFSCLILDKPKNEVILATDLVNIYPIYYLKNGDDFYVSNSIILLGRYSKAEKDPTGIFQRAVGPNFMNIGSRTILENCKRLLPGERIKFDTEGKILEKKFDNSLYQNIGSPDIDENSRQLYWDQYKKEVELFAQGFDRVNIALSGGIDSRMAFGAINNKEISAYTFGHPNNYESKIASSLARKKGASHTCFYDLDLYFPPKKIFFSYTRNTEAVKLNSWLEILSNLNPKKKEPLLLGELCEGLPGRNIKAFNKAHFRRKNFFRYYLKNKDVRLTTSSKEDFLSWKKSKIEFILSWHSDNWFKRLKYLEIRDQIIKRTIEDSEEIFERIESHNLPFTELYEELFSWYTFTRMELSRQVNIGNEQFYAASPAMSIQMLKRTSNLHPNIRLYYRFANRLLSEINDLKIFRSIPTSQIPLIPQNSPNILKIPIWGIRSKLDDWYIKRMVKTKDPSKRYRLFKSINWAEIYQQPGTLKNFKSYYSSNYLTQDYFEIFYQLTEKRGKLEKWPFANMDIISGATLNAELELIQKPPS
ncbi:hypothetical protein MKO06_00100 [Gramella sp. GC03-9]|uniref:asparagine synthase (glutamine-hydrolyzing) n=1 Tax=Christiangramia oceanisediminis TaxID=2920386 RepID=A0A9X2I966_9FLAO|nr:hypothetical protein [Gramella oceanisediminis]MCP9198288.1 hypothetical protein [Gramella oceanisediminis]